VYRGFAFIGLSRMSSENQSRCLIWGGYAWGNTGDELCLAAALERMRRESNGSVAILSPRPEYTARLFPDAKVIPFVPVARQKRSRWERWLGNRRRDFVPAAEWQRCLQHAERLYLAGGGYLSDLFGIEMFMTPVELAIELGVPVATAPVGIGPFAAAAWAERVARALGRAEVQVRDPVSLEFCRQHGVKAALSPDDAFAVIRKMPGTALPPPARPPKIGVCIVPQAGRSADHDLTGWWTECLRGLKTRHPQIMIEGFCFHTSPNEDIREMTRLFPLAGLPVEQVRAPVEDFCRATLALREYDFIISTRFHATVAANVFQIPNVAIAAGDYYMAKMRAAASGYEALCEVVDPKAVSAAKLVEVCGKKLNR
jgi:polysaccharide pyruvyl transferase WcaK-like protein